MAVISRPTAYGLLTVIVLAAGWWFTSEPPKAAKKPLMKKSSSSLKKGDAAFAPEDLKAHFDKPTGTVRNVFHALIVAEKKSELIEPMQITAIPGKFASGESNWVYTGIAEVDGVKLALLENSTSKQSGFLKEGEFWKKSRLVSINLNYIVVQAPDGTQETVYRFNPNDTPKPKPPAEGGFRPYDLSGALAGPIGQDLVIQKVAPEIKAAKPIRTPKK